MDLTQEILFNNVESTTEESSNEFNSEELTQAVNKESSDSPVATELYLEANEFVIEHGLDVIILNSSKLKDLTLKALLTKYKDSLSIVPAINSDFVTVVCENQPISLESKITLGKTYTVYTNHQVKG